MKAPKIKTSEIVILRNHLKPKRREITPLLLEANHNLPKGKSFGVSAIDDDKIIIKGNSIYGDSLISILKENKLNFIAKIFKS